MEHSFLPEISDLLSSVKDERKEAIVSYLQKCLDPNTPSHEISLFGIARSYCLGPCIGDGEKRARFDAIIREMEEMLMQKGYRKKYFTFQEHLLFGSPAWEGYAVRPYAPLGLLDGRLSVAAAQKARALARVIDHVDGAPFCLSFPVRISLEPLDEHGDTIRDPQLLDSALQVAYTVYASDFPLRRAQLL